MMGNKSKEKIKSSSKMSKLQLSDNRFFYRKGYRHLSYVLLQVVSYDDKVQIMRHGQVLYDDSYST